MPIDATTTTKLLIIPERSYQACFRSAATDVLEFTSRLDAMLTIENHNGFNFQASTHAYKNAKRLMERASGVLGRRFPRPEFIPDGEGGIDIEWEQGQKRVAVSCRAHPSQQDLIYWRELSSGGYEGREVSLLRLVERFRWLART